MAHLGFPAAILFDMDGLLVDSEPTWHAAEKDLARALGVAWTDADARACVGVGLAPTCARIMERSRVRGDVAVLVERLIELFLERAPTVGPKPGARAIVDAARARGIPIAVATSSPRRVGERVLSATGFLPSFDAVAYGDEVPATKPDPAVYLLAADRLGVDPDRALVLEDSPSGCQAGRRAGATVYAVPEGAWRGRGFEDHVDGVFGSLDEVVKRLGW